FVQGEAPAEDRAGDRRVHGGGGAAGAVGGRPPQAPQVLRRRGRPAFAVEVRGDGAGADEGPVVGAHRLDVRRGADAAGQVRTGPDQGPGAAGDLTAVRPVDGAVAGAAGADRRSGDDVVVGGVHRVLLGVARPGGAAAPRDVVDQLDLSRGRQAAVQVAGPFGQRVVAGGAVVR